MEFVIERDDETVGSFSIDADAFRGGEWWRHGSDAIVVHSGVIDLLIALLDKPAERAA